MNAIVMPPMVPKQTSGWLALLEVSQRIPVGWSLVGGQLVHLHCVERGQSPTRPTTDLDTVLDIRGHRSMLRQFTEALLDLGFTSAGRSAAGHEHRWLRPDGAQFDLLIPRHLGDRASKRRGATGATTIEAPGTQQALDRTEKVLVRVGDQEGQICRPNLLGALVGKAATSEILIDPGAQRHAADFAVLASLLSAADLRAETISKRDASYLGNMLHLVSQAGLEHEVDGARRGLNMIRSAVRQRTAPASHPNT
ncbi:hypothetical protein [Ruania zhangjianzhongii]|uniref:hypothetical protein n=1 Tax=Ruania zhangjianzhongii TaxID=2603206 RepID=UPI0011CB0E7E|nr:hypothetical protein [Ruania zhangjianzhongii]